MWGGGIPVVRDEGHDPATGDLVMALARRVRRAHVRGARRLGGDPRAGPRAAGAGRCRRDAPLGPRRGAAHRPAVGHGGGRRAGGPGAGCAGSPTPPTAGPPAWCPPTTAGGWWSGSTTYAGRRRSGSSTCSRRPSVVRSTRSWPSSWGRTCDRSCRPDRGHRIRQEHRVGGPRRARGGRHRRRRSSPARSWRAGRPGWRRSSRSSGPDLLTPDGDLDRAAMGPSSSPTPTPAGGSRRSSTRWSSSGAPSSRRPPPSDAVVVHDIPLLAEGGRADTFDAVVVVDAPAELQVRADGRGPGLDPRGRRVPDRRPGDPRGAAARSPPTSSTTPARSPTCAGRSRRSTRSCAAGLTFPARASGG